MDTCGTCEFWTKETDRGPMAEGLCRRFPSPQPVKRADGWCGEFKAAPQPDPEPEPPKKPAKKAGKKRAKKKSGGLFGD